MFNLLLKHKQIIKYLIAGGVAALVDLNFLYFLTDIFGVWYLISASLAFAMAFFVSFFLQKFWTFRDGDKEAMYKQMGIYLAAALINLALNAALMYILVDGFKVWYMLAQLAISGLIACESYFIYKFFIFNGNGEIKTDQVKILIATGIYPPDIGGPATYADNISRELKRLNCEIKIITYGESQADKQADIIVVDKKKNIFLRYFNFFLQASKLAPWADVIYTLDLVSAGLPATLAAKLSGKKIIFRTGGDFLWEKAYQSGWTGSPLFKYYEEKKNWREKFLMTLCRWLLDKINLIIFSTEFQAKIYKDYYNLAEAKIRIVANAFPRAEKVLASGQYHDLIIFAGRLIKLKNLKRLINALSKLKANHLKLIIFGQGPEKKNLQDLINKLNLTAQVEIKENVEHKKLISLIGGCKFFILPSVTEISPNLALECLSLKKPIILTKETGLAEALTAKLILINPESEEDIKNKIEYLLDDKNLAEYKNNLEQLAIESRGWEQIALAHFNIFKALK